MFKSPLSALFFRKKIVFQRVPASLVSTLVLFFSQFERPYWQIHKTRFPISIFLISQWCLSLPVPRVSLRLFSEDATSHLKQVKKVEIVNPQKNRSQAFGYNIIFLDTDSLRPNYNSTQIPVYHELLAFLIYM